MTGNLSRRMVDFRFSYVDIMVRSARRLDGTGRTGYIYNWKNGHIQMRNHAETGTVTGVSIGINRCRGESFYAWFRIFFIIKRYLFYMKGAEYSWQRFHLN